MITDRTLKLWRLDALSTTQSLKLDTDSVINVSKMTYKELQERILRLTQELMDQNILNRR